MELKVDEIKSLAPIKFNYEDIKKWVTEKAKEYKSVVYTEETITAAKTDRATLNKVAKAINDEKIRIKKEVLKPFEDFENKCKELQGIITDASNSIDIQVKSFEEKEQKEKKDSIRAIFDTYIGDFKDLIQFDLIFNPRWLNKTYSMKKIEEEINHLIVKTNTDLGVIDGQFKDESVNKAAKIEYFSNISNPNVLTLSMLKGNSIIENNKKLEEFKKQQDAKNEDNAPKISGDAQVPVTEEKMEINFKVIATKEQFIKLAEFLKLNNIDYRRI
jgi:hypothetical protein